MDFEQVLLEWARRKFPSVDAPNLLIESVEIEHDPGNSRDDSFYESPSTSIVIRAHEYGRGYYTERVTPDLLTIVREMSKIAKEAQE